MKFRKKPVVIEAMQFKSGMLADDICKFVTVDGLELSHGDGEEVFALTIPTPEGDMTVSDGDWIIKGVKGEFYPCKPDIFAMTYEAVDRLCDKKTGDHGDDYYCGVLMERLSTRPCYQRIENDMRKKCYSRSKEECEFVGGKCAHCGKVFP